MVRQLTTDVLVVGAGPIGALFARYLVPAGRHVWLADAGGMFGPRPGANLKNLYGYQRNPAPFAHLVAGLMHLLSEAAEPGLPAAAHPYATAGGPNPRQDPATNLTGAAAAYAVGGMGIHWTCVTPRQHPVLERSPVYTTAEWDAWYAEAEAAFGVHPHLFERSIRHQVVRDAVAAAFAGRLEPGYAVGTLPFAAAPHPRGEGLLRFAGADTVLAPILDEPALAERLRILPEHAVRRLQTRGGRVVAAEVVDWQTGESLEIHADTVVVAGGTVLGAQLLWHSGIRPAALGRYLTEHPICFGQVQLAPRHVARIRDDPRFADWRAGGGADPADPLRLPPYDLPPNVWIPVCAGRPWHVQITKDVVHFTPPAAGVDDRVVVDLRYYAPVEPRAENHVTFEADLPDVMGLPRPTFHVRFSEADRAVQERMAAEMRETAAALGAWLPGAEPRMLPKGTCLHLQGACRIGAADDGTCVADADSRVWGFDNLVVAGNCTIPSANACNPTLTAAAIAVRAARRVAEQG